MRLKRILVDYMLRMSYYDTAAKLAESSNIQVVLLHLLPGLRLSGFSMVYSWCSFFFSINCRIVNGFLLEALFMLISVTEPEGLVRIYILKRKKS